MPPACLDTADAGIGKIRQQPHQEVSRRQKVRVKDGNEVSLHAIAGILQRTSLETMWLTTATHFNSHTSCSQPRGDFVNDDGGIVVGIVKHLDQETVVWVLEAADGAEQTLDDVAFVVHRQLNCDGR